VRGLLCAYFPGNPLTVYRHRFRGLEPAKRRLLASGKNYSSRSHCCYYCDMSKRKNPVDADVALVPQSTISCPKCVGRCYTPIKVIAVFTVPLAQHHARQFKKHVRKGMVQHPVVNLNTRFRPETVIHFLQKLRPTGQFRTVLAPTFLKA